MPIYEYECQACGRQFELHQRMGAPAPEKCPRCGQGPVRKLISRSGFVLKGSGFYTTDYASPGRRAAQKADTGPAPAAAAKPPAETKPDAPAKRKPTEA